MIIVLKEDIKDDFLETLRFFCHTVTLSFIRGFLAKKCKSITGDLDPPFTVEASFG